MDKKSECDYALTEMGNSKAWTSQEAMRSMNSDMQMTKPKY